MDRKTIVVEQETLVKKVFAASPHTIEVLRSSFPYAIVWSQQNLPAIVHMTHNSQEEGHGLADVLFGDYSPAGRLDADLAHRRCATYAEDGLRHSHGRDLHVQQGKAAVRLWLRVELHDVRLRGVQLSAPAVAPDGTVQVTVKVKNTGARGE